MVFSETNSRYLAEKIYTSPSCPLGDMNITHFVDSELAVSYKESIRDACVFLVRSIFPNSDNLVELLLVIDAVRRASARSVVIVIPYFGWARQNRRDKPRASIGTKLVADLLSIAGTDRLIAMDLHVDQVQGSLNIPVGHLYASAVFLSYTQSLRLEELVIMTPNVGGSERASTFSKYLGVPLVLCSRSHERTNEVAFMQTIGDVRGKNVVLIDSTVDTVGTTTKVANIMLEVGANSMRATVNHCVMLDPAPLRVQESGLAEMVFTDSIPYSKKCVKVKQLGIANMFAGTIKRVMNSESVSSRYAI